MGSTVQDLLWWLTKLTICHKKVSPRHAERRLYDGEGGEGGLVGSSTGRVRCVSDRLLLAISCVFLYLKYTPSLSPHSRLHHTLLADAEFYLDTKAFEMARDVR